MLVRNIHAMFVSRIETTSRYYITKIPSKLRKRTNLHNPCSLNQNSHLAGQIKHQARLHCAGAGEVMLKFIAILQMVIKEKKTTHALTGEFSCTLLIKFTTKTEVRLPRNMIYTHLCILLTA